MGRTRAAPTFASSTCCVTFIKFFQLSGGVRNGTPAQRSEEGAALRRMGKGPL